MNIEEEVKDLKLKSVYHINEYTRYRKSYSKEEAFKLLVRKFKKGSKVSTPDGIAFVMFRTSSVPGQNFFLVMFPNGSNRLYAEGELNVSSELV